MSYRYWDKPKSKAEVLEEIRGVTLIGREWFSHNQEAGYGPDWAYRDLFEDRQNSSPTLRELLELADEIGENRIKYIGYTVLPPRSDWRVTVDGFIATFIKSREALNLLERYGDADERDYDEISPDVYKLRFWWD